MFNVKGYCNNQNSSKIAYCSNLFIILFGYYNKLLNSMEFPNGK